MSNLPCPKCGGGPISWVTDTDDDDLLETGIMECDSCKEQYVGIPGWENAMRIATNEGRM